MARAALRLFLVRHGEVRANLDYRYLGRRDDGLDATGERQAEALAELFREFELEAVLSSPLQRALTTARAIAAPHALEVVTEERLLEMSFGEWEGMTRDEVQSRSPADREHLQRWERDPSCPPPGGESLADVQDRCLDLVRELESSGGAGPVVLVSHVGPIKALLCAVLGLPLDGARRMFLDPATVTVADWGPRPVLRLYNAHGHLGWHKARWM